MSAEANDALCQEWQSILGLRDWTVHVTPAQTFALGREHRTAEVQMDLSAKHARLSVLSAQQAPTDLVAPHDEEDCLVHELLHLHFEPVEQFTGDARETAIEQAINAIARALVSLKRAGVAA